MFIQETLIPNNNKGIIIPLVLSFGAIFLIILSSVIGFVLLQITAHNQRVAWYESLNIAEAGVNYYRWCLNHQFSDCPTEKEYFDAEGQLLGEFSIDVNEEISCGQTIKKEILSSGWTVKFPNIKRKISVLYGRPSVAKYSYIINDNVWAGNDRQIRGLYRSNGGIRMDGTNFSLVTSAQQEWVCTDSFGCSSCPTSYGCRTQSSNCICPGVFTTTNNSNTGLFQFPVTPFDFQGITVDLAQLKSAAQINSSYFQPSKNINSNAKGYHLKLKNDGTFEVWIITGLLATQGYSLEEGDHYDHFIISGEYLYNTYTLNSSCGVIFFEDNLWIEGTLKGKATIASANLIDANQDTNIVLSGNITYTTDSGSDALGLIAEKNMLISPNSPDTMVLRGIFIAQKGRFGRNHYNGNIKTLLQTFGSTVSYGRTGTQWTSGGHVISGYLTREDYIDSNLIYGAPSFMPYLSPDFKIINWQEL